MAKTSWKRKKGRASRGWQNQHSIIHTQPPTNLQSITTPRAPLTSVAISGPLPLPLLYNLDRPSLALHYRSPTDPTKLLALFSSVHRKSLRVSQTSEIRNVIV
ncbi:hypothetical protein EUGRSUZ_B01876 [Eucalyptus grandis]|uniref:Uncharacterized protein n=2 Tax=Eucalyptus grandis TaxID=71139 RepID=A0ACC3LT03_EUCGR|nr:hypothetical protein EUGRSUZ_B01876 [Eucalyptus grandis]